MDSLTKNPDDLLHRKPARDSDLPFECGADATGYWFAAAVVFAFLVAGVIVYRTGNEEIRIAANDIPAAAAQSDPLQPGPILQLR